MLNKTAIITGGSRGIGKAIALNLAENGCNIVINYNNSEQKASELKEEIEKLYKVKVLTIKCDVSKFEDVENLYKIVKKEFDSIDFLINNAGITKDNLILRMKETDFDQVININLKGTFNTSKIIGKHMLKQKSGKIVNISSIVGVMGNAGQ